MKFFLLLIVTVALVFGVTTGQAMAADQMPCLQSDCDPPAPPPPPPPPGTPDYTPVGWHDYITAAGIVHGWTCDANDFNYGLDVHIYVDGGYVGKAWAGEFANEGVAQNCGGNWFHAYNFRIPDWLRDGQSHSLVEYAINICGSSCTAGNPPLAGTGQWFNI